MALSRSVTSGQVGLLRFVANERGVVSRFVMGRGIQISREGCPYLL